jgi:hypothetical protein
MQQFARVQQGNSDIPAVVSGGGLLDLRPLVSDIAPDTIGSGVLAQVNAAVLKPIAGDNVFGAYSGHTTDTGDRLQLQETHRGNEGAHANRARGFP